MLGQKKINRYCPVCGKSWTGVTGGFDPKKMDSLEAIRCYKEAKESLECPFCKETEMNNRSIDDAKNDNLPFVLQDPRYTLEDVFLPHWSQV
ncbi:hypothetical protein [Fibrobacter sp.]|uniref:hypothetical protein n=1 Tax=Fibrobacter sp. TaxID=35828 RepID=UPI0026108CC4|nr:hypothetical protein [Fibrobacter sp.]MDD5943892.1 hypothetical protein [Fibrobacter sp.]